LQSNMKHHVNIIFLGLFLNLCYGTPTGPTTPTFSLSEERSFDGSPKINVVFANGKSDTMILTKFDNGEEEEPEEKIETEAEVEECRYLGHLENEPSACIAMTGCPGVDKVEFTIFSKNVFDSPSYVWTKEGSVEMIEMENSKWDNVEPLLRDDYNDTYVPAYVPPITESMDDIGPYVPVISEPMVEEDRGGNTNWMGDSACDGANNNPSYNFDGGDCCVPAKQKKGKDKKWCKGNNCLCKTMKVDLKIGYGSGFVSKLKYSVPIYNYMMNSLLHAQPFFCHKSLGYRIKLSYSKYSVNHKFHTGKYFRINDKYQKQDPTKHKSGIYDVKEVERITKNYLGDANLMVFFGYDKDDFKSDGSSYKTGITFTTGIARTGVLCAPHPGNKKDKFSINEWNPKGTAAMGALIAHELGHNLGMRDDHFHGGENGPCVCKGVMSYAMHCRDKWQNDKTPVQWSTCSVASWTKHYVDTLAERTHPWYVNTLGLPKWCMTPDSTNFCGLITG